MSKWDKFPDGTDNIEVGGQESRGGGVRWVVVRGGGSAADWVGHNGQRGGGAVALQLLVGAVVMMILLGRTGADE